MIQSWITIFREENLKPILEFYFVPTSCWKLSELKLKKCLPLGCSLAIHSICPSTLTMGDYSVATKNRFQLSMLDNSDDEDVDLFEILKQEEAKQEKKKPEEVVTKKNAKSRSDKNTKPKKVPQQQVQNKQVDDANTANIQKSGSANRTARGNGEWESETHDEINTIQ